MKQHEAKAFLPIIKGWSEGQTLEYTCDPEDESRWTDCQVVHFTFPPSHYRLKPKPKYRPWTQEELPFPCLVKFKDSEALHCYSVIGSTPDGVRLPLLGIVKYQHLLDAFLTINNQPCGKVITES